MGTLNYNFSMKLIALIAIIGVVAADIMIKKGMPEKSLMIASMLSLGGSAFVGLDRFYMGYWLYGIIKCITFGGLGVWAIIDAIWINWCWLRDSQGRVLKGCTAKQVAQGDKINKDIKDSVTKEKKSSSTGNDW